MENNRLIAMLNDLLALERESHLDRLVESDNFVSWAVAGRVTAIRQMAQEESEHEQWLTDEIFRLHGAPYPHALGMDTAGAHYLDFQFLFPLVVEDKQRLVAAYKRAVDLVNPNMPTARLLSSILARQQAHLAQLMQAAALGRAAANPPVK